MARASYQIRYLENTQDSGGEFVKSCIVDLAWCHFQLNYTLSEAWSGVNWADLMAAQGAFGTDFYDRSTSILRLKHRTYYRSGRPVIKIGPKAMISAQFSPLQASDRVY